MNLRKAVKQVLEAFDWDWSEPRNKALRERMKALRQALAQPEQEPVGYVTIENISSWAQVPSIKWFKKPTEREWAGLTDEEIEECKINGGLPHAINWRLSVKVMEAKLKEKNT